MANYEKGTNKYNKNQTTHHTHTHTHTTHTHTHTPTRGERVDERAQFNVTAVYFVAERVIFVCRHNYRREVKCDLVNHLVNWRQVCQSGRSAVRTVILSNFDGEIMYTSLVAAQL